MSLQWEDQQTSMGRRYSRRSTTKVQRVREPARLWLVKDTFTTRTVETYTFCECSLEDTVDVETSGVCGPVDSVLCAMQSASSYGLDRNEIFRTMEIGAGVKGELEDLADLLTLWGECLKGRRVRFMCRYEVLD